MPGFGRQHFKGIGRALSGAAADQGFRQHHRDTDQRNAQQKHQDKGTATVDADHVGKLPDTAQAHGRTRRGEYEDPTASPAAVDRNLV